MNASDRSGPWVVLVSIVTAVCAVMLLVSLRFDIWTHWDAVGVPTLGYPFGDTRFITAAWECVREGVDVFRPMPCDPSERPWVYGKLPLVLSALGLGSEATVPLGLLFNVTFFAAVFAIVRGVSTRQAIVVGLLLLSPPTLLGVERGNLDLFFFALIAVACAASTASSAMARSTAFPLLLVTSFSKFYSAAAYPAAVMPAERRKLITRSLFLLVPTVLYVWLTLGDISTVLETAPRPDARAYGSNVLFDTIARELQGTVVEFLVANDALRGALRVIALVLAIVAAIAIALRRLDATTLRGTRDAKLFLAGAGIYIGTFILGNNYDYRLIFLLLALPQLFSWQMSNGAIRRAALLTLAAIVLAFVASASTFAPIFLIGESATWLLFALLSAFYVRTVLDLRAGTRPDSALQSSIPRARHQSTERLIPSSRETRGR